MTSLFEYDNYKLFLSDFIANSTTRGYQSMMAEAAGCRPSYISQVLNGNSHLTPEHAIGIAEALHFKGSESDFFLLLVQLGRAGTKSLQNHYRSKIKEARDSHFNLCNQFSPDPSPTEDRLETYYSHWSYAAIHVLTSISEYSDEERIARRLTLPIDHVRKVLKELQALGYVIDNGGDWCITKKNCHLQRESALHRINLLNWRQKAHLHASCSSEGLHYSGVHSLSRTDIASIELKLIEMLSDTRRTISHSPEEEIVCLNLDWFKV